MKAFKLGAIPYDYLRSELNLGKSLNKILSKYAPNENLTEVLAQRVKSMYLKLAESKLKPLKGVKEALSAIKSSGLLIGLATGSKTSRRRLKAYLERHNLLKYFDAITYRRSTERAKPHPDLLQRCAEYLGVGSGECVYVGDAVVDVKAGKAAGMRTAAILTGVGSFEELLLEEPDCVVKDMEQLIEKLNLP